MLIGRDTNGVLSGVIATVYGMILGAFLLFLVQKLMVREHRKATDQLLFAQERVIPGKAH